MTITEAARVLTNCAATERLGRCMKCGSDEANRFAYANFLDIAALWVRAGCTTCGYLFIVPGGLFDDAEQEMMPRSHRDDFATAVDALRRENREILNTIEDLG